MKHLNYFLLVVGICLLAQCAQPDPAEIPEPAFPADPAVESFGITPEDAAAEALAAREALSPATRGQAIAVRSVVRHGAQTAVQSAQAVDPSFYVVNFEQESGFAIVAADRRQQIPVYAISDEGSFPDPASMEEGTLGYIFSRIASLASSSNPAAPSKRIVSGESVTGDEKFDRLIQMRWGVTYPFEGSTFRTAICQIMSYFEWPAAFDWDTIKSLPCILGLQLYNPYRDAQFTKLFQAVDNLQSDVRGSLARLGYTCNPPQPYSFETVRYEIIYKRPVYAFASSREGCIVYNYGWLMDGIWRQRHVLYPSNQVTYFNMVHCNLCNDGQGNGYYAASIFNLGDAYCADGDASSKPDGLWGQRSYRAESIEIWTNIAPYGFKAN
ncbi:Spi family protease inhibitor [Alistipes sp.]|uniref:Spi family protease inhibitor n=2 Tax=Alistipes sp. TaxID=1872444 RepID=UPI003AB810BB